MSPFFEGAKGEFVAVFSKFGVLWPGTLARFEDSTPRVHTTGDRHQLYGPVGSVLKHHDITLTILL